MSVFKDMCRDEYESYHIYRVLSRAPFVGKGIKAVLVKASSDEYGHYLFWKSVSGDCGSSLVLLKAFIYLIMLYMFGLTIVLRIVESKETYAIKDYKALAETRKDFAEQLNKIILDEERHESEFMSSIDEKRIKYIGSITLGISDALIELTGVYTGALGVFNNTLSAGIMGILTGVAASLSMGAASYNQARQEGRVNPALSAVYTMAAYIVVTLLLALPYLLLPSIEQAFVAMFALCLGIIAYLSAYIAILQERRFIREFLESAGLMLSVSLFLYFLGSLIRSRLELMI